MRRRAKDVEARKQRRRACRPQSWGGAASRGNGQGAEEAFRFRRHERARSPGAALGHWRRTREATRRTGKHAPTGACCWARGRATAPVFRATVGSDPPPRLALPAGVAKLRGGRGQMRRDGRAEHLFLRELRTRSQWPRSGQRGAQAFASLKFPQKNVGPASVYACGAALGPGCARGMGASLKLTSTPERCRWAPSQLERLQVSSTLCWDYIINLSLLARELKA